MIINILLVLLGLALLFVFFNRRKDEEKARLGIIVIAFAAIVLSGLKFIGGGGNQPEFEYDAAVDAAVAEVAADRIAEAAQGRRAVLVANMADDVVSVARLNAFRTQLEKHQIELLGVQSTRPESDAPGDLLIREEGVDRRIFEQAIANHQGVEVLISLVGLPVDFDPQAMRGVEVYAFDDVALAETIELVERGMINGVVVGTYDGDWSDTDGSKEDIFDRRYVFVTPQNVRDVRGRLGIVSY